MYERWRLRNGCIAVIGRRSGKFCAGNIEGSDAIHTWVAGKSHAGPGYDLVQHLVEPIGGRTLSLSVCPAFATSPETPKTDRLQHALDCMAALNARLGAGEEDGYLRQARGDQTLQPTALINEAYIRLIDQSQPIQWQSRAHFFGIAARIIAPCVGRL